MAIITEDDRKRMGTVDATLVAALKEHPFPNFDPDGDGALVMRKNRAEHLKSLRPLYPIPGPIPEDVDESLHHVTARDGHQIPIKIYKPIKPTAGGGPLMIQFHEGGWCMGDRTDEDLNCRMFARDLGATSVNVDYRLAPEDPFPLGLNDCYDVVKWCATTAAPDSEILPANPRKGFTVGGASAGGNLAAVMSLVARDDHLDPPLTGQYLCVPSLCWNKVVPQQWAADYRSRSESCQDPVLPAIDENSDSITPLLHVDPANPLFSPLRHENLKNLPPAFFQICGLDPLRDEGLIYEHVLRVVNGVKTRLKVYDGYGHMFWTNFPTLKRSDDFVQDTLEGFRWLLNQVDTR